MFFRLTEARELQSQSVHAFAAGEVTVGEEKWWKMVDFGGFHGGCPKMGNPHLKSH